MYLQLIFDCVRMFCSTFQTQFFSPSPFTMQTITLKITNANSIRLVKLKRTNWRKKNKQNTQIKKSVFFSLSRYAHVIADLLNFILLFVVFFMLPSFHQYQNQCLSSLYQSNAATKAHIYIAPHRTAEMRWNNKVHFALNTIVIFLKLIICNIMLSHVN